MLNSTDGCCLAARSLIVLYASGELSEAERVEVRRHLDACRPCAGMFEEAESFRRLVRRAARGEPAPERLRQSIRELIREG